MSPQSRNAYMAGLMDGEGSFSIGVTHEKGKPHYAIHIRLYNTNRKLLKWAKQQFGGEFKFRIPEVTNIDLKQDVKPMGTWWLTGRRAMESFLLAIIPYLIAKQEQANLLLQYIRLNGKHDPTARQILADKISFLNNSQDTPEANTQDDPIPPHRTSGWTADWNPICVPDCPQCAWNKSKIESELAGDRESVSTVM